MRRTRWGGCSQSLPTGHVVSYVYDGSNRRVGKKLDGVLVQGFLYRDSIKPTVELDGAGSVVARFVYGTNPIVPDYVIRGGNTYRIFADQLGSPRVVVDVSSGAVVERIDYDERGNTLKDTNAGLIPFGFAGGIVDRDTGLIRFGTRDYDPQRGRWSTKDAKLLQAGLNVYLYCFGDPRNWIDPTGLDGSWLGKAWAAVPLIFFPSGTQVGLTVGGAGWVASLVSGGKSTVDFGNNAIEFKGVPGLRNFTPAVTLGNVICYADPNPSQDTQDHERQHTYQAETLGPAYLPAQIGSQVMGFGYSFADDNSYSSVNARVHSDANLLEQGPSDSRGPHPWP